MAAFAVALSAPDITDIRRPFHDTVGLFYGRILFTDAIKNGSIPFWYPYTRYSIPMASLEGGMGWSPIGFLVGLIGPYNLLSWATEGLIWNLVCLYGTFFFSRRHVSSPFTAAAIAMTYSAGGLLIGAIPTIGTARAFQIGPLAFYAVDTLVRATSWNSAVWARGTLTLTATGVLWLSSAYPGIWLTAPVLMAPYALLATRGRQLGLLSLTAGALTAAILSLGVCAVLVDGTFNAPLYGEPGKRTPVSPSDGALIASTMVNTFLANPGYLRDTSGPLQPRYLGAAFVPGLLLLAPRLTTSLGTTIILLPEMHGQFVRVVVRLFLVPSILFIIGAASVYGLASGQPDSWLSIWIGISSIAIAAQPVRNFSFTDFTLITSAIFSLIISSSNVIGDYFRANIPPFTMIRWNDWYSWVAALTLTLYVWRNIEKWVYYTSFRVFISTVTNQQSFLFTQFPILLGAVISFILGVSTLPRPVPIDYNVIHSLTLSFLNYTSIVYIISILSFFLSAAIRKCMLEYPVRSWFFLFICVPIVSGLIAHNALASDDQSHRTATAVGPYFHQIWDLAQATLVPVAAIGALQLLPKTASYNSRLAIITSFVGMDMIIAAPRILSHTDYLRAGQVGNPTPADRSFSFTGNYRVFNDSLITSGNAFYNSFIKSPDQLRPGDSLPQMKAYDTDAGFPSPFQSFVVFPPKWYISSYISNSTRFLEATADLSDNKWYPNDSKSISYPTCDFDVIDTANGIVTKILTDKVIVEISSPCARLVVLMDTWAPGWTVSIDGRAAAPVRVNGVLRGVEVPSGMHVITWEYRPEHWTIIVWISILSLTSTIFLAIYSGIMSRNNNER